MKTGRPVILAFLAETFAEIPVGETGIPVPLIWKQLVDLEQRYVMYIGD